MPTSPVKDNAQAALYEEFANDSEYTTEDGLLVLPVADGDPVVVRVSKPFTVRRQKFKVKKQRTPGVFPAPRPDGPSADGSTSVCVGQTVATALPRTSGSNPPTLTFEISGEYLYIETVNAFGKLHGAAGGLPGPGFPTAAGGGGNGYPFSFPTLDAEAAGALIGGLGVLWPLLTTPVFTTGNYSWPATTVGPAFADPNLS